MLTFKYSFYSAVNGIFSKVLKVILELVTTKCRPIPILLYGLESWQLSNGDMHSLDFTYNRMCIKLFKSLNTVIKNARNVRVCDWIWGENVELIKEYQSYFHRVLRSLTVKERCQKFISKYEHSVNTFCQYCSVLWLYIVWVECVVYTVHFFVFSFCYYFGE